MKKEIRIIFQAGIIVLPRGFTFAYHEAPNCIIQKPPVEEIHVVKFMEINWLGGGYMHGNEKYAPIIENGVVIAWRLDAHGFIFSKQFFEGRCSYLSEDLFDHFRQTRISNGGWWFGKSPENEELFRDLKNNTRNREVVWVKQ